MTASTAYSGGAPALEVSPHQRLLADIAQTAGRADRQDGAIGDDVHRLMSTSLSRMAVEYADHGGHDSRLIVAVADALRRIGRANLSVGRIIEGHFNALRLIGLYGDQAQKRRFLARAGEGAVFGVWGADGPKPVAIAQAAPGELRLRGSKRFASGLGLLRFAVVTTRDGSGHVQLVIADANDPGRADPSTWKTSGMRATASGDYAFDGMSIPVSRVLGDRDVYMREPHFEGGVWRYAAVQLGGLEALTEIARRHVRDRKLIADSIIARRITDLALACETGRLWVESACVRVEAAGAGPDEVAYVLLAREAVEQACVQGMTIVDRLIGAASFFDAHPLDRIRRDLSFYLRQANLDGKAQSAARSFAASDAAVGEMWR